MNSLLSSNSRDFTWSSLLTNNSCVPLGPTLTAYGQHVQNLEITSPIYVIFFIILSWSLKLPYMAQMSFNYAILREEDRPLDEFQVHVKYLLQLGSPFYGLHSIYSIKLWHHPEGGQPKAVYKLVVANWPTTSFSTIWSLINLHIELVLFPAEFTKTPIETRNYSKIDDLDLPTWSWDGCSTMNVVTVRNQSETVLN